MGARKVEDPAAAAAATFNMTPMIDVTFQLIVVFLCSMKFRTLDQKIEANLPKDVGCIPSVVPVQALLDVSLRRPDSSAPMRLSVQGMTVGNSEDGDTLWSKFAAGLQGIHARDPEVIARISADPDVEHGDVIRALDALTGAGFAAVEFRGTPPPGVRRPR